MADLRKHSSASNLVRFALKHLTTGDGLTGLTEASAGLIVSTIADNEAAATAYTVAGSTIETITTLGTFAAPTATKCRFKEVDATNHPGLYEFQFADARFAVASAKRLVISVSGATNLLDADYEIQLVGFDPYDGVRLGLTALPNAAAATTGGMFIIGTGAGAVNQEINGTLDANVRGWKDNLVPVSHTAGYPIVTVKDGTGTGEIDTASGKVQVTGHTPQTGDSFARLGAGGAGLTAIPWNVAWDAEVQSECADAITAASVSTLTAAQVNAEVLDVVNVDPLIHGKTFVAAMKIIAASTAGKVSGAGTGTEAFLGLDGISTVLTVLTTAGGNRISVVYS